VLKIKTKKQLKQKVWTHRSPIEAGKKRMVLDFVHSIDRTSKSASGVFLEQILQQIHSSRREMLGVAAGQSEHTSVSHQTAAREKCRGTKQDNGGSCLHGFLVENLEINGLSVLADKRGL
jgi:hypothetical protein